MDAPRRACGPAGERIALLWNQSIAFQKFQRYAHGDSHANRREGREAAGDAVRDGQCGQVVFVRQVAEVALLARGDEGLFGPVDALRLHGVADDEEVRERLGRRPGPGDDVDDGLVQWEVGEESGDPLGVDVVEVVGVDVGVECLGDGGRAEGAAADTDRQDGLGVLEPRDGVPNLLGVGRLGEVERGVAVFVVRATLFDSVVGVGDASVQPFESLAGDAGRRIEDVSEVDVHG